MSGHEVFAAVAAVVSAFYGGADLVAQVKRRKGRRGSQEQMMEDQADRKRLQVSLETAESQIGFRYAADMNKHGDLVRVGDAIARDRLLHIAVVIQTDIIMSLQLAVKYENAALDLHALHEASIINRRDTIDALDDLKQRIHLRGPLPRTLTDSPYASSDRRRSSASELSSRSPVDAPHSPVPDVSTPKAATITPVVPADIPQADKTGLARYFSSQRSTKSSSSNESKIVASESANLPPALNYLLVGKSPQERKSIMKDIDEIIVAYQGVRLDGARADALAQLTGKHGGPKRDTLAVLQGGNVYNRDTMGLNRDALQLLKALPPTPDELHPENKEYPAFYYGPYGPSTDHRVNDWIDRPEPAPLDSRWSSTSAASSVYSDHTICSDETPSLYRNNSDSSSRGSLESPHLYNPMPYRPSPHVPSSVYSTVPFWTQSQIQTPLGLSPNTSRQNSRHNSSHNAPPVAPFSVPPRTFTPPNASFASQQQSRTPIQEDKDGFKSGNTRIHLVPNNESDWKVDPAVRLQQSPLSVPKPMLPTRSISPQPAVTTTVTTTAQEKMMDGRPCKDNNYWGFCKGAWATREDTKKGVNLETRPEGMYNTSQVWQCKHCNFEGSSFSVPHPTKRNKKEVVVDPTAYTSAVGIRYRWLFLAKSHVKKKTNSETKPASVAKKTGPVGAAEDGDTSFGCVVCSVEGNVTGIYGNIETLMNHIFMEHVRPGDMTDAVIARSKCIVGRIAGDDEEWDYNVPVEDIVLF